MKRLAGLFSLCMYLCIVGSAPAEQTVVVSFLGDCTLGCEEQVYSWDNGFAKTAEREGYAYFFEDVEPLLSQDDLTVANLEVVLKRNAYSQNLRIFNFRGLPEYAQILPLGSVEAVGLENNHTDDYGVTGRRTTKTALEEAGVNYFDAEETYIFAKDGVRIAFLSVQQTWMFDYGKQYMETVAALKANGVNAVVVYVHFGEEYNPFHIERQTATARKFIDAGADLIVGSHPHVVQGIELYENRLILYSLGNFVFGGNVKVRALQTVIPQITFTFSGDGKLLSEQLRVYPAHISGDTLLNDFQPHLVTGGDAAAVYRLIDQDSEGFPVSYKDTESYREYAPVPAEMAERY